MSQQAYPLAWPPGFPRTREREKSKFKTTLASALGNVRRSLELFGKDSRKPIAALIISSNYSLGDERPADPGVAVYFQWEGLNVCIPVDRYATLADNLQAIHHIIEARRVELRHGSLQLAQRDHRFHEAHHRYHEQMMRLDERSRTKCRYCGKMTPISWR